MAAAPELASTAEEGGEADGETEKGDEDAVATEVRNVSSVQLRPLFAAVTKQFLPQLTARLLLGGGK